MIRLLKSINKISIAALLFDSIPNHQLLTAGLPCQPWVQEKLQQYTATFVVTGD